MNNDLAQSIEAILFATSQPQSIKGLSDRLGVSSEEVEAALGQLAGMFEGHGIMLLLHSGAATLVTRPQMSELIENIRKEELSKELSKASAETLAIIAYAPGATKAQIEFIRGVNASYSIRALSMRGLIEQRGSGRGVYYAPTMQALEHFGVSSAEALPQYAETAQKIQALLARAEEAPAVTE